MSILATKLPGCMVNNAQVILLRNGLDPLNIKRKAIDIFTSVLQGNVESYFSNLFAQFKAKNFSKHGDFPEVNLDGAGELPEREAGLAFFNPMNHPKFGFLNRFNFYSNFMLPQPSLLVTRTFPEFFNQTRLKKGCWNTIKAVFSSFERFITSKA